MRELKSTHAYSPFGAVGMSCGEGDWNERLEPKARRLALCGQGAEGVAAVLARVVIQDFFVDLPAYGVPRGAARRTTEQHAHEATGQTAKDGAYGASKHSDGGTGLGTSECSGSAASSTGNSAHDATGFATVVAGSDLGRVATGAGKGRDHISLVGEISGR